MHLQYFKKIFPLGLLCLFTFLLVSCRQEKSSHLPEGATLFTVHGQSATIELHFNGTIKPLEVYSVTSPVDSVVVKKLFEYGQQVKKDDLLLLLNSQQLRQDYQSGLTEYLKAKDHHRINKAQMEGIQALNRLGIISKNEYMTSVSSYNDAALSFTQAEQKLFEILKKIEGKELKDINQLRLEDTKAITEALTVAMQDIPIRAPAAGVVLLPSKETGGGGSNEGAEQKLDVGSQVKSGQRLVAIGNMSGAEIEIKINEVEVNRIKPGQPVTIVGPGFPKIILKGEVRRVDAQASNEGNSAPQFPVKIIVPTLTDAERQVIRVGMSVKATLALKQTGALQIPIQAVSNKGEKALVRVWDTATNSSKEVAVATGETTQNLVEIKHGLKEGDKVVIPNTVE
jgi:HlyD family secretion protein